MNAVFRLPSAAFALAAVSLVLSDAVAFTPPDGVFVESNGTLRVSDAMVRFEVAASDWTFFHNDKWGDVERAETEDILRFRASFSFGGEHDHDRVPCEVEETLRRTGPETLRVEAHWRFKNPVRPNAVFAGLQFKFPITDLSIDGEPFAVPSVFQSPVVRLRAPALALSTTLRGGWRLDVSGDLSLQLQDNRFWTGDTLSARIHSPESGGEVLETALAFNLRVSPPGAVPLPLAGRPGGDLPCAGALAGLPERMEILGFPFVRDNGAAATNDLGEASAVELLHAADWARQAGNLFPRGAPVGRIIVEWTDGGTPARIDVGAETDVGHWADDGVAFSNASPAWTGGGATLYASSFAIPGAAPGRRIARVAFEKTHPAATWFVAAATLSSRLVAFPSGSGRPRWDEEGPRWARLDWKRKVVAGSALDFSFIADSLAPAGRDGFVTTTPDGFFSFEQAPEKRVRFHGVNLCGDALFLEHWAADNLVETLRRTGYNALRIHHHDAKLVRDDAKTSLELDPERLEKLDYLIAACKKGGLYITTDLHVGRPFRPGDGMDCDDTETLRNVKGLLPVSEKARENLKAFARAWLGHVNPYTGLALKDDPVLATLSLVNEEMLELAWGRSPELASRYRALFAKWKAGRGLPPDDESSFNNFLDEVQCALLRELADFVKIDLGVRCPIVPTASETGARYTRERTIGDAMDLHAYFSHPQFPERPWCTPIRMSTRSPVREAGDPLRKKFPDRVTGKPLIISEICYCYPSPHRTQGAPLLGACAGMQGWGGLWRYVWSHSAERCVGLEPPMVFDAAVDPFQQLGDRIVAALFARGDMAPSTNRLSWCVRDGGGDFPDALRAAGLRAAVGCHLSGAALPAGVREWSPGDGLSPSDPRFRLDPENGTFAAVTSCTEALALERGDLAGDALAVSDANRECVIAAISRDGAPLRESGDILLLHLTNLSATGAQWDDDATIRSWGGFPLLVERGSVRISLATDGPRRVEALDADGNPAGVVPVTFENGRVSFLADVSAFPCGVVAYRLQR